MRSLEITQMQLEVTVDEVLGRIFQSLKSVRTSLLKTRNLLLITMF